MYPARSFNLVSMIGKINKTLNIANQVIPLYVKAKPIINNAKDALKVAKVMMEKPKGTTVSSPSFEKNIQKKPVAKAQALNKPVFFL